MDARRIADAIAETAMHTYSRKKEKMAQGIYPYIKEFVEERQARGPIGIPVTDGRRMFNIRADIEEAYNSQCANMTKAWEKTVLLSSIDKAWQEQLREMDELRKSVQNASYEQKDPLVIYKLEAYELWKKMVEDMNAKSIATLMRGRLAVPDYEEAKKAAEEQARLQEQKRAANAAQGGRRMMRSASATPINPYANYSTTRDSYPGESAQRRVMQNSSRQQPSDAPQQPAKAGATINRNDLCPCGSGKKYKNCHGKDLED